MNEIIILAVTTSMGNFDIELYPKDAPITVENFVEYVDDNFFENVLFHRIIPGFVIQGGGFEIGMNQKPTKDPIKNWDNILNIINEKDERIYGLIKKSKLKLDDDNLVIDLGDEGNDFIKTTLLKKTELIEQAVYNVTNKRNKIKIITNIKKNDIKNKQEHPLLDKIKNKFDSELDRS